MILYLQKLVYRLLFFGGRKYLQENEDRHLYKIVVLYLYNGPGSLEKCEYVTGFHRGLLLYRFWGWCPYPLAAF